MKPIKSNNCLALSVSQTVTQSLLVARLDWCDPGVWKSCNLSKSNTTSPCLRLQNLAKPNKTSCWSLVHFLRQSFVKILKPILAMLWFQKRLVYLPFPNLPDIPSLRICINFHYVGKKMCFLLIFFLWLSFRKADWPDLPSLYCLQYSPVSASPGQQNTKLPAWQSEKHEI